MKNLFIDTFYLFSIGVGKMFHMLRDVVIQLSSIKTSAHFVKVYILFFILNVVIKFLTKLFNVVKRFDKNVLIMYEPIHS